MQLFATALVASLAAAFETTQLTQAATVDEGVVKDAYFKFVALYGKSYATIDHMQERYDVFRDNYVKIETHNSSVDQQGRSPPFTLGVNQFSDMTEEEFVEERLSSGIRLPKRKTEKDGPKKALQSRIPLGPDGMPLIKPSRDDEDEDEGDKAYQVDPWGPIPTYKNWMEEGFVTRPYDQGGCGACWAFTAASTLESLAMITATEKAGKLQEYSVQQLMDCDQNNFVCDGGWMYEAYEYVKENGINLKSDYKPYRGRSSSCDSESVRQNWHFKNTGQEEHDGMSNTEMKRRIMQQPMGSAIFAPGLLMSYKDGVMTDEYLHCSRESFEVNHGITVIGFGETRSRENVHGHCEEYWIIRNSWGRDWGEHGTFKLCMDGAFTATKPLGTCHINEFGTWPTLD